MSDANEKANITPAIWLMDLNRYKAVDGPFLTIQEIPQGIFRMLEDDPDYCLQVWPEDYVDLDIKESAFWREDGDE